MIEVHYEKHIMIVLINRPEKRNAIDLETANEIQEAFEKFENDDSLYVAIISGKGGNFSAGADLTDLKNLEKRAMDPNGPLGFTRRVVKKPVIAAISGYCVAGGFELALWADFRIAEEGSKFGFLERRFGVPLIDGGTQRLPLIAGLGNALYLILTGKLIDAREAYRMGIVNEIVPNGQALTRAIELAMEITKYPQITLRNDRLALLSTLNLEEKMRIEAKYGKETLESGIPFQGAEMFKEGKGRGGKQIF